MMQPFFTTSPISSMSQIKNGHVMKTLDLNQAAGVLRMNPEVLRRWAKVGKVPASKIGKRWIFIQVDLIDFVRSKQQENETPCLFIKEEKSGGLDSLHQTDKEYLKLLELKTG